jgi:hypothetical protein
MLLLSILFLAVLAGGSFTFMSGETDTFSTGLQKGPSSRRSASSFFLGNDLALFGGIGVDSFGDEEMLLNSLW